MKNSFVFQKNKYKLQEWERNGNQWERLSNHTKWNVWNPYMMDIKTNIFTCNDSETI